MLPVSEEARRKRKKNVGNANELRMCKIHTKTFYVTEMD